MIHEKSELLNYIEKSLNNNFEQIAVLKNTENSSIVVYRHKNTGKKIIKRVSENRNDDVYRALKNVKIPNLANILEVSSENEYVITLEEYIDGKSLEDIISEGRLDLKTACRYTYQLCNALNALHERKIIHRDIKPSNIVIGNDNKAYLIDLSIARIQTQSDHDTQTLGTVEYAAPEQFGIIQSSRATDIYALGIVLNKMLTGVHPSIQMPTGLIGRIIKKTTSIQISQRYSSAKQLQKKLKYFI